jgi:hypothetical protein
MAEWLFPRLPGDPAALGEGAHWQYRLHEGEIFYLWSVTFGVLPLLAVLLGAARREFWNPKTLLLAGAALVTLALSFGFALPFYRLLYSVEILRRLRYPIKFYLLTTLCVALLAGFAVDSVKRRRSGKLEVVLLAAAAAIFAAGFFAAAPGGAIDSLVRPELAGLALPADRFLPAIRSVFRGDALLGLAAVALLAVFALTRQPRRGSAYAIGVAALVLALPWGLPLFVSADQKALARPPALRRYLSGGGRLYASPDLAPLAILETRTAHPEVAPTVGKLVRAQIEELIPATAAPFGVRYLFDEDPDGSYGWVNRIAGEVLTASTPDERARLVRLYGGRWSLSESGSALPGFEPVTGFSVAGHDLVLHEAVAQPDLRWATRAYRRASLSGALELARSDVFRPATDVVLPGAKDEPAGQSARPAKLAARALEADRAQVDVDAPAPGHLVWSRTFFPAWKATVDRSPAPVLLANGRDLAVAVPAGRHRVDIVWNPDTFRWGVALQAGALLAAVALAAVSIRSE